ncbi:MAG TPA: hypothetical protein VGM98_09775 [Schlesneria sp.]|jgi:Tfp pilus assembly protein PilV
MTPIKRTSRRKSHRRGTTLSEVLVSMLIMSVGVVSLATLFPISVLRSIQATQLTNATNLRYNVEGIVSAVPQIRTIGTAWQPLTAYTVNTWVVPSVDSPLTNYSLAAVCTVGGTSANKEPNWLQTGTVTDGATVTWNVIRVNNYIVDPQGEYAATYDDPTAMLRGTSGGQHMFGNNPTTYGAQSNIRAFSGLSFQGTGYGLPSQFDDYQAVGLSNLPDSWILQGESKSVTYVSTSTPLSCTLNDLSYDLSATTPLPAVTLIDTLIPSRIMFFDITGKFSVTRPITSITGTLPVQTITWSASSGPLPFLPATARVESAERRFSWMLSIMHASSTMDVVVFFRRKYNSLDEQIYPATFQTGAIDQASSDPANDTWAFYQNDPGYDATPGSFQFGSGNISELGSVGSDDSPRNWVVVQYDPTGNKPFYKKGGFVTDIQNLQWYRITDVVEGATPTAVMTAARVPTSATNMPTYLPDQQIPGYSSVLLKLERPITMNSQAPSGGAGGIPRGGAVFMRGIVEVYPIPKS